MSTGRDLAEFDLAELQAFDGRIEADVFEVLTLEGSSTHGIILGVRRLLRQTDRRRTGR